jgi:hypothetical protein
MFRKDNFIFYFLRFGEINFFLHLALIFLHSLKKLLLLERQTKPFWNSVPNKYLVTAKLKL